MKAPDIHRHRHKLEELAETPDTWQEKMADKVVTFGGSWGFIVSFFMVLLGWMAVNAWLLTRPFDPYPFIFLNLMLSCLAAIQAPIIMMSQNRMEAKDRKRAVEDYHVNLKAEAEIRDLRERLIVMEQQQREMLDLLRGKKSADSAPLTQKPEL